MTNYVFPLSVRLLSKLNQFSDDESDATCDNSPGNAPPSAVLARPKAKLSARRKNAAIQSVNRQVQRSLLRVQTMHSPGSDTDEEEYNRNVWKPGFTPRLISERKEQAAKSTLTGNRGLPSSNVRAVARAARLRFSAIKNISETPQPTKLIPTRQTPAPLLVNPFTKRLFDTPHKNPFTQQPFCPRTFLFQDLRCTSAALISAVRRLQEAPWALLAWGSTVETLGVTFAGGQAKLLIAGPFTTFRSTAIKPGAKPTLKPRRKSPRGRRANSPSLRETVV
jgi:hypothetical protein